MSAVSMYAAAREKAGRKTSTRAVQTAERIYYVLNRTAENASYQCEVTEFAGNGRVEVYCNDRKIGEIQGTGTFTFEIGKLEEKECDTIHFVADNVTFCLWSSAIL